MPTRLRGRGPVPAAAHQPAGREPGAAGAVTDSRQNLLCAYLSAVLFFAAIVAVKKPNGLTRRALLLTPCQAVGH